jgi:hypothetical protein
MHVNRILDRTEKAQRLGLVMKPNSSDKRHPLGRMEQMAPDRWYWLLTRSEGETEHRLQLWAVHPDAFKEFRLMGDHGRLLSGRREKHGFDGISTDYWVQIATRAANGQFLDDEPMPSQMISIEYNTLQRTAPRNRGRWVSSVEAAKRLGVSKNTLIRYINSGKVNARHIVGPGGWCYQVDMSNEPVQTQLIAQPITEAPVEPLDRASRDVRRTHAGGRSSTRADRTGQPDHRDDRAPVRASGHGDAGGHAPALDGNHVSVGRADRRARRPVRATGRAVLFLLASWCAMEARRWAKR